MAILLFASLLLPLGESATLTEDEIEIPDYLVFRVTTQLQRSVLLDSAKDIQVYVLINGMRIVPGGARIDVAGLDFDGLVKALRRHREQKADGVQLHLYLWIGTEAKAETFARWAMSGLGWEAGFTRVRVSITHSPDDLVWKKKVADTRDIVSDQKPASEDAIGDASVLVYPVRTPLSRFLADEADCVVQIVSPFDDRSKGILSPEIERALQEYVGRLKLESKGRVLFCVRSRQGGLEAVGQFTKSTAERLGQKLGFTNSSVRHEQSRNP